MRRIYLVIMLVAVCGIVAAQQKKVIAVDRTFSNKVERAQVSTTGGYIVVDGSTNETKVEVILSPNSNKKSTKDLKEIFREEFDLQLEVKNKTLIAKAKRKENKTGNNPLSVSFKISVPRNTNTDLQTAGGSISISELKGTQQFATSGGSLSLINISGNINGRTSGGSISASKSDGDINLYTSGGSISLQQINGKTSVHTAGGSISADGLIGRLVAQTSGGSIKLNNIEASVDAQTSGGSISASLKQDSKPVSLSTSAGSISISLPKGGYDLDLRGTRVHSGDIANFSGTIKRESIVGKIDKGGRQISARTASGSVNVSWY